jgi:hypothetical protein
MGAGVFGRLMRVAYLPFVDYPYAAETYPNLASVDIFSPLGFILIAYSVVAAAGEWASGGLPRLIFAGLRRRRRPILPLWLSLPLRVVAVSSLELLPVPVRAPDRFRAAGAGSP